MVSDFRGALHNSAASHYTFYIHVVGWGGARFNIANIGKMTERKRKISRSLPSLAPPPPSPTNKRKEKRKERKREKRKTEKGQRDTGDWVLFLFCILICTISEPGGTQNVFAFSILAT